jgi:hypothetical protein
MFGTTKRETPASSRSAFVAPSEVRGSDIWAQAGRAIELAYREPAPISQTVRVAVAVALLLAVLIAVGALP